MTVLSRGARVRRGGRRPGWQLLTALLVLAIAASSALVFTNRVELLKLAVILALWAAAVAAFVSVIYRRQSDVDQARARDLKLVYDLQLDREISARREYELTVESQLRRELASDLRAQAADEVAALRAELAALRTNLEILIDAELDHRPALESERGAVRGYSDWEQEHESLRDRVNRVASVRAQDTAGRTEDSSIIDVPEVGVPPHEWGVPPPVYGGRAVPPPGPGGYAYPAPEAFRGAEAHEPAQAYPAPHWQQHDRAGHAPQDPQPSHARWVPPEPRFEPQPAAPPEQRPAWATPDVGVSPASGGPPAGPAPATDWQPVSSAGQWSPPGTQRRGRHSSPAESMSGRSVADERGGQFGEADRGAGARHSSESSAEPPPPGAAPVMSAAPEPTARHRGPDLYSAADGPQTGGQSVADLLARLQVSPTGGGRRRRRQE